MSHRVSRLGVRWLAVAAMPTPSPSASSRTTSSSSHSSTATSGPSQSSPKPGQLFYQRDDYVVRSKPVPGGEEQQIRPLTQGPTLWLAADAKNLYWIKFLKGNFVRLKTSTLDGGGAHLITKLGLGANGLAVRDGYVYWANGRGYGRVKPDGSELDRPFMTLPPDHGGAAEGFAIADGNVYFSDCAGRRIGRVALTEGPASSVEWLVDTGKLVCPGAVTVGGGYLYWWDHERATVSRATTDGEDVNARWLKVPCGFGASADLGYLDRYIYVQYSCTREGRGCRGRGREPRRIDGR